MLAKTEIGRRYRQKHPRTSAQKEKHRLWMKTYYKNHTERVLDTQKRYKTKFLQEHSLEEWCSRKRAAAARWRQGNRELAVKYTMNYRLTHPEYIHKYNLLTHRENQRRRRARMVNFEGCHQRISYREILKDRGLFCPMCGVFIEPRQIHFDHIKPIARGGLHINENLQVAHGLCNQKKWAR